MRRLLTALVVTMLAVSGCAGSERPIDGTVERIGRLNLAVRDDAAAGFVTFLRDGEGERILIDSGLLRQ